MGSEPLSYVAGIAGKLLRKMQEPLFDRSVPEWGDLACYTPALAKPELMILQPQLCSLGSPVYLGRAASNVSI
jgi:hypothetical protein